MKIRFGDCGELDMETLELRILGKTVKVRPVARNVPEHFLEPFIDKKEPEAWVRIEGRHVFVKTKNGFFEGKLTS